MSSPFWMIHATGGGPTSARHPSRAAAEHEAERLARANPGTEFVLLESTESFRLPLPPIERRFIGEPRPAAPMRASAGPPDVDDDIPF